MNQNFNDFLIGVLKNSGNLSQNLMTQLDK